MKKAKKFASLILTFALIMQMIPGFTPQARAYVGIPTPDFELGLGLLLRGFNALADEPANGEVDKREVIGRNFNRGIFNNNAFANLREYCWYDDNNRLTDSFFIKESTVEAYSRAYGVTIGQSVKAELSLEKIAKLSIEQKWSTSVNVAYNENTETMFFNAQTWRREAEYDIDFDNIPEYVVQEQLTTTFKEDLLNASPAYVFDKYGTHFLTQYTLGGWVDVNIFSTEKLINNQFNTSTGLEGTITALNKINADSSYHNSNYVSHTLVYGGSGGVVHTTDPNAFSNLISSWTGSFDKSNYEIVTVPGNNVKFEGIWELLPAGNEDRYYQLIGEYITRSADRDTSFFDNYIYKKPVSGTYYGVVMETTSGLAGAVGTGAYVIPSNAVRVSDQPGLINALSGGANTANRYVVLEKDINLTGNWAPINDFRGTLDGNGYKITNLNVYQSPKQVNAGLFGSISTGVVTIKNLGIEIGSTGVNAYNTSRGNSSYQAGGLIGQITGGTVTIRKRRFITTSSRWLVFGGFYFGSSTFQGSRASIDAMSAVSIFGSRSKRCVR